MLKLYACMNIHLVHIFILFEICLGVPNKFKQHFPQRQPFIKEHILSVINNTDVYLDPKSPKQ